MTYPVRKSLISDFPRFGSPVRRGCPPSGSGIGNVGHEFLVPAVANSMITCVPDGRPVVDESAWPQGVDLRPEKVAALRALSLEPGGGHDQSVIMSGVDIRRRTGSSAVVAVSP